MFLPLPEYWNATVAGGGVNPCRVRDALRTVANPVGVGLSTPCPSVWSGVDVLAGNGFCGARAVALIVEVGVLRENSE